MPSYVNVTQSMQYSTMKLQDFPAPRLVLVLLLFRLTALTLLILMKRLLLPLLAHLLPVPMMIPE